MASGFDATSFATGIIGSANQKFADQRKDQNEGELAQYQAFQEAAKEYDKAKASSVDEKNQIDAFSHFLNDPEAEKGLTPDQVQIARLAVARDAVENKYTGPEHLPYVQSGYTHTLQDVANNPDKWGTKAPQPGDDDLKYRSQPLSSDSNPGNTRVLQKFNPNLGTQDIENVRQHQINTPYNSLPASNMGNYADASNKQLYNKTMTEQTAKNDASSAESNKMGASLGLDQASTPTQSQQASAPQTQVSAPAQPNSPTNNPIAMSASSLQPNAPLPPQSQQQGNISQPREAAFMPQDGSQSQQGQSPQANTPVQQQQTQAPAGVNTMYMDWLQKNNPQAASMVKGIASGELQVSPMALRPNPRTGEPSPMWKYVEAAQKYDPSFDMTDYNARNRTHIDYTSGQTFKNIQAIDTATSHLGILKQAGDALNSGNYQLINKLANTYGAQVGKTPQVTYNAIAERLAPEIVKAYIPTGGVEAEREAAKISSDLSGSQRNSVIAATGHLLSGKMEALQNSWDTNMGPSKAGKDFFSPNTHDVLKSLGVNEADKHPFMTNENIKQQNPATTQSEGNPDWSHWWGGSR